MPGEKPPPIELPDHLAEPDKAELLQPGVERLFDETKRGTWSSGGPQGQDNAEGEVLGEVLHEDDEVYYHMRDTEGRDYYAPKNEVRIAETAPVQHIEVRQEMPTEEEAERLQSEAPGPASEGEGIVIPTDQY